MTKMRLRDNTSGATAIEYAIIAGLLALGIVGSLVTTKTSLNSVFGSASTGVAGGSSAGGGIPALATSTSPQAGYWSSKTLASAPVSTTNGTTKTTTYLFTDGTKAVFVTGDGLAADLRITDPNTKQYSIANARSDGKLTYFDLYKYDSNFDKIIQSDYAYDSGGFSGNPPYPSEQISTSYVNGGSDKITRITSPSQTSPFSVALGKSAGDISYFRDVTK